MILHRTVCRPIGAGTRRERVRLTGASVKLCGDRAELDAFAYEKAGADPGIAGGPGSAVPVQPPPAVRKSGPSVRLPVARSIARAVRGGERDGADSGKQSYRH
jgi:hypothetical protein